MRREKNRINLAILLSGAGSTAQAILTAVRKKRLPHVQPVVVISSSPHAKGITIAERFNIPTVTVEKQTEDVFANALLSALQRHKAEYVSQNGWLPKTPEEVIGAFPGRIINQHPGPLDPGHTDFGGQHMYGLRVVLARICYAWCTDTDYWTESTVHHVTTEYDKGALIRTHAVSIPRPSKKYTLQSIQKNPQELIDVAKKVQKKLLSVEHENVISVLDYCQYAPLPAFLRAERLVNAKHLKVAKESKKLITQLYKEGRIS